MKQLCFQSMDFHGSLYWELLLNPNKVNHVWLKSDKNEGHFIGRSKCICVFVSDSVPYSEDEGTLGLL
jgi:hypothetical protein